MSVTRNARLAVARAAALMLLGIASASAQQAAGGFVARATVAPDRIELSAAQVRAILTAHQPAIVAGTSDDNIVTIVIASNGDYVASGTSTGAMAGAIRPAAGGGGTFGSASASSDSTRPAAAPRATAVVVAREDDGQSHFVKFAGIGDIDSSLIKDMYLTHFSAGEVGVNGLAVRIVTLKGTAIK